jgi:hypothetical protein
MAHECLFRRTFQLHAQVAQESSVPQVAMVFEQPVCLLEGKEVDDQAA